MSAAGEGPWDGVHGAVPWSRMAGTVAPTHILKGEDPMRVLDVLTPEPFTVAPSLSVVEARHEMTRRSIRHLLVTDHGALVGIVTDRDIRLALPSPATSLSIWEVNYLVARLTVREIMTTAVITVDPDRGIREAARLMIDHKIGALPVVVGGRVVGIVTETDLLRALAEGVSEAVGEGRRDTSPR